MLKNLFLLTSTWNQIFIQTLAASKQNNSSNLTATSRFPDMIFYLWIGKSSNISK